MLRQPSGMVQVRARDSTVRQDSSQRHSRLERDREAPIMEMLKHLPFCKNPKVQNRVNLHQIIPGWFLPVRKSDSYQLAWWEQPANHQADSKEEVRHRRKVKPLHHTTLMYSTSNRNAGYLSESPRELWKHTIKSELSQTLYAIPHISTTSN